MPQKTTHRDDCIIKSIVSCSPIRSFKEYCATLLLTDWSINFNQDLTNMTETQDWLCSPKCLSIGQMNIREMLCSLIIPYYSSFCMSSFEKREIWGNIYHTNYETPSQPDMFGTIDLYFLETGITMNGQKYLKSLQDKLEIAMRIHGYWTINA